MIEMLRARAVLSDGVSARIFPGAVVEVGHAGGMLATAAEGRLAYDVDAAPVDEATIYDLASLTKVLATTTLALDLVGDGRLALDDRVGRWISAWRGDDRAAVTVRHLLDHSSGLPAHRRYFEHLHGRAAFEQAICAEPLEYSPGSLSKYSDPGFMLLGFVLEQAGGAPLDRQFDKWRVQHLGPDALLQYRPPDAWKSRIAPTEDDPWRGRVLRGEVHDENAAALDGVAAHAGLFGTAASVGAVARWWLKAVTDGDAGADQPSPRLRRSAEASAEAEAPALRAREPNSFGALARRFVTASGVRGSSRALGWDTMRPTSSCGSRLSSAAFGHTGFTGTSLWIDPAWRAGRGPDTPDGLYVVFLSNRVHPSRRGDGMTRVRQALHDAVADDLWRA